MIPENPMVDERSSGVKCSQDHEGIGKELVHLFHRARKTTISGPRGSDLKETEERQGVAACKLEDNARNPYSGEKDVKSVVGDAACKITPYT